MRLEILAFFGSERPENIQSDQIGEEIARHRKNYGARRRRDGPQD